MNSNSFLVLVVLLLTSVNFGIAQETADSDIVSVTTSEPTHPTSVSTASTGTTSGSGDVSTTTTIAPPPSSSQTTVNVPSVTSSTAAPPPSASASETTTTVNVPGVTSSTAAPPPSASASETTTVNVPISVTSSTAAPPPSASASATTTVNLPSVASSTAAPSASASASATTTGGSSTVTVSTFSTTTTTPGSLSVSAQFQGPFYFQNNNNGRGTFTDFYFQCLINVTPSTFNPDARFDVALVVDGTIRGSSPLKSTNMSSLVVNFTSCDTSSTFGHSVSCAVRWYWKQSASSPSAYQYSSSSYFIGISWETDPEFKRDWFSGLVIQEKTPSAPLRLYATVPIACPPCAVTVPVTSHSGVLVSNCSVTFRSTDQPLTKQELRVRAVQTPGTNSRTANIQFENVVQNTSGNTAWNGYRMPLVKVLVVDERRSYQCSSTGDPHFYTFDSTYFNVYFGGDFILWRRVGTRLTEIHVRQRKEGYVAYNCAIAVREDNNVIGVYACDYMRPPKPIRYLTDPDTPGANIRLSSDGYTYTITMPSGTYVTVQIYCWWGNCMANIYVYPVDDDNTEVEGLCGNANGDKNDDLRLRNSIITDYYWWEPVRFSASYMLKPQDSLINGHIYYPKCVKKVNLPQVCECGKTGASNCASVSAVVGSSHTVAAYKTRGTDSCVHSRKRRDISTDVDDSLVLESDDLPSIATNESAPAAPLHNETLSWPTPGGITENEATDACKNPIIQSPVYSQCVNFTNGTLDSLVKSCVDDVQLLDNKVQPVDGILARFHELCVFGIQQSDNRTADQATADDIANNGTNVNSSSLLSPALQQLFDKVSDAVCPGQPPCNGSGNCSNSVCICNPGFIGSDCSVQAGVPPVITGVENGRVWDARKSGTVVILSASGFAATGSSSCKAVTNSITYFTPATLIFSDTVQCVLPLSPVAPTSQSPYYSWTLSLSNNNVTFGNSVPYLVYDSICMSCSSEDLTCRQLSTACLIEGKCFSAGAIKQDTKCDKCIPSTSSSSWTHDKTIPTCRGGTVKTDTAIVLLVTLISLAVGFYSKHLN